MVTVDVMKNETLKMLTSRVTFKQGGITFVVSHELNLATSMSGFTTFKKTPVMVLDFDLMADRIGDAAGVKLTKENRKRVSKALSKALPKEIPFL